MSDTTFTLDGEEIGCEPGDTVLHAAARAGHSIPHLCHRPGFRPHGSCRVCSVRDNGRVVPACTAPAHAGDVVESETPEIQDLRRTLVQLLFVEGNHFCPSCEQSGNCTLQAVAYELGVVNEHFPPLFPDRPIDASHPEILLDFNRCILCELCVRASADVDHKNVFALSGRGIGKHLVVNAESGRLADTTLTVDDAAANVCPVGVILRKGRGFIVPIGKRRFDTHTRAEVALAAENEEP